MMARIDAKERLAAINDRTIAAGNVEKADSRRMIASLEAAAAGGGGTRRRGARARPEALAGMGIGVRIEPSRTAEKGLGDV